MPAMNSSETRFFIGSVEQAAAGGYDPLSPAISISRNGTLAKWRGKIHFMDLRVNDPGLKKYRTIFVNVLQKALSLGIEVFLTLPEVIPTVHELPPEPPVERAPRGKQPPPPKKPASPLPVVTFKDCLLAVPRTVSEPDRYHALTVEECLPILELAREFGVKNVIVPTSRPGLFLDPAAGEEFKAKLKILAATAKQFGITLHVRTGGLSFDLFRRIGRELGCMLALDAGWTHLERNDLVAVYEEFREKIGIILLHQVQPGIDKWGAWKDAMELAWREYQKRSAEWRGYPSKGDAQERQTLEGLAYDAYRAYQKTIGNELAYQGIFQSGDINYVPFLKTLRKDLETGRELYLLLETVPNMKNVEFLARYLLSDSMAKPF